MSKFFPSSIHPLIFYQPHSLERVALLRVITVAIALTMLIWGPYDTSYHVEAALFLYRSKAPFLFLPPLGAGFFFLKIGAILIGGLALLGWRLNWSLPLFTLCYGWLNFEIHAYQEHYCMNQAHLNFILIALCLTKTGEAFSLDQKKSEEKKLCDSELEKASWVLFFSGAFIATLLFQTGLAKLVYGGVSWFTTGDTIYVETILDGTSFGRQLTAFPSLFPLIGKATAIFELGFPWLFFWKRAHVFLGLSLLLFHLGTWTVMGISFWFLWPLYFPTFLGFHFSLHKKPSLPSQSHFSIHNVFRNEA